MVQAGLRPEELHGLGGLQRHRHPDPPRHAGNGGQEVLPIDAARFAWTPCDLTGLLNRPLADEVAGDGKGGWTDQGPTMDLRNLHAGDYTCQRRGLPRAPRATPASS